jgi:hypothetical protein
MATYYITGNDSLTIAALSGDGSIGTPATGWANVPALTTNDIVLHDGVFRTRGREWSIGQAGVRLSPQNAAAFDPLIPHSILTSSEPTPVSGWTIIDNPNRVYSTNIGAGLTLNAVVFRYFDTTRFVSWSKGGVTHTPLAPKAHMRRVALVGSVAGLDNSWHYDSGTGVLTIRNTSLALGGPTQYAVTLQRGAVNFPEIEYCRNVSTASQITTTADGVTISGGIHLAMHGPRQAAANYNLQSTGGVGVTFAEVVAKDASFHNIGVSGSGLVQRMTFRNCWGITSAASTAFSAGTNFVHYSSGFDVEDVTYDTCTAFACHPLDVSGVVFTDTQSLTNMGTIVAFYAHTNGTVRVKRTKYINCSAYLGWTLGTDAGSQTCSIPYLVNQADESTRDGLRRNVFPMLLLNSNVFAVPFATIGTPGAGVAGTAFSLLVTCSTYLRGGVYDFENSSASNRAPGSATAIVGCSNNGGPCLDIVLDSAMFLANCATTPSVGQPCFISATSFRSSNIVLVTAGNIWSDAASSGVLRPQPNRLIVQNCTFQDRRTDKGATPEYFASTTIDSTFIFRNNIVIRELPGTVNNSLAAICMVGADYTSTPLSNLAIGSIVVSDNLWIGWSATRPCWIRNANWAGFAGSATLRNTKADFFRATGTPLGIQRDATPRSIDTFSASDVTNLGNYTLTYAGAATALLPGPLAPPGSINDLAGRVPFMGVRN